MNHLSKKDADDTIKLLVTLFIFAYEEKHGKKKKAILDINDFYRESSELLFESEASSKRIITKYLETNKVGNRKRRLLESWKGRKKRNLYYIDENEEYSIFYDKDEDKVYGVKGMSDSLGTTLSNQCIPVMVHYTILPYQNFYILDTIGMTNGIDDLEEKIDIYEKFRLASLHKPTWISDEESMELIHLDRVITDKNEDVFQDYLRPLMFIVQKDSSLLEDVFKIGAKVWNDSVQGVEYDKDMEDYTYFATMMKRKKEQFAQYRFIIKKVKISNDQGGLRCELLVKKDGVEQLSLFDIV